MPTCTAAQRRRESKIHYNILVAECPSRQLLDTLGDKWVSLVIVALAAGSLRHGELARTVAGVSQKMLTQTLRALERDGLISRTVTPSVPVRVDYALTSLGANLEVEIRALRRWAETHMARVLQARRVYDARAARMRRALESVTRLATSP